MEFNISDSEYTCLLNCQIGEKSFRIGFQNKADLFLNNNLPTAYANVVCERYK